MRKLFQCFYFIGLLLLTSFVFATEDFTGNFNVNQDRATLEKIEASINHFEYVQLQKNKSVVSNIENRAQSCIKKTKKEFSQLEELSATTNQDGTAKKTDKTDNFLEEEKSEAQAILSDCKLLLYESQKLRKLLSARLEQDRKSYTFLKTSPLWEVKDKLSLLKLPNYNFKLIYQLSGIQNIQTKQLIFQLNIVILFGLVIAYLPYRFLKRFFPKNKLTTELLKLAHRYFAPIFVFALVHFFLDASLHPAGSPYILSEIFKTLSVYSFMLFFIQTNCALFAYKKPLAIQQITRKLSCVLVLLVSSLVFTTLVRESSPLEAMSTTDLSGYKTLLLALLSFLALWVLKLILKLSGKYKWGSLLQSRIIKSIGVLFFLSLIAAAVAGYDAAALFIAEHIIKTCLLIIIFIEVVYALWNYARILNDRTHPLSIRFHHWVGLKPNKNLVEITILKVLLSLGCLRVFARLFLMLWELPAYYLTNLIDFLENEIYLFEIQINIIAVLRGLSVFCLVIILGRMLGAYLSRKNTQAEQKNARITIITLTNYVAFVLAFLIALMVMGINLSGFALVASALSVGIGFGLKGIAADLISGLILLLSKPLSPGDHIEVKGIEGFIQKIRLLSTELRTLTESRVIIPNSTLLGQSVINYTYRNKLTRITSEIMLKEITDVKRAEAILLKIAKKHPEVHQDEKHQPEVMVELRTDKTTLNVVLTLWCLIKDVDDRYRINSDINAKVLAAIEKAGIPLKL